MGWLPVGWHRLGIYYVSSGRASSMEIDPSGCQWQVLLVSLIPTQLQARRFSVICHTIFSVSLWTSNAHQRNHECLRQSHHPVNRRIIGMFPQCVSIIFCFWLSANPLSSPVNGYSEGRRPKANVGVHSNHSS